MNIHYIIIGQLHVILLLGPYIFEYKKGRYYFYVLCGIVGSNTIHSSEH